MRKYLGFIIAKIGGYFWTKGGFWNESNQYDDLKWYGKLGYNTFCTGLKISGITREDLERVSNL